MVAMEFHQRGGNDLGAKGEELGLGALGGKFGFGGWWVFILFLILILLLVGIN
jgi:hypothetical protein